MATAPEKWVLRTAISEQHGGAVWCIDVAPYKDTSRRGWLFATATRTRTSLYSVADAPGGAVRCLAAFDEKERETQTHDDAREQFFACAFGHDPHRGTMMLALSGQVGTINLLDLSGSGSLVRVLPGHCGEVFALRWLPTRPTLLLSASKDGGIRLWNTRTGHIIALFQGRGGHRAPVLGLAVHPSGTCCRNASMPAYHP